MSGAPCWSDSPHVETIQQIRAEDLPAIFSSLEIAAPPPSSTAPIPTKIPIAEEQERLLINALRVSLNLGTNVDETLFKEMAEAMVRCKVRCMAEEQEETIEKLHRVHLEDVNTNENNKSSSHPQTTQAESLIGGHLRNESTATSSFISTVIPPQQRADTVSTQDIPLSEGVDRLSSTNLFGTGRLSPSPTKTLSPLSINADFFQIPPPPESPWPATAQKHYPEPIEGGKGVISSTKTTCTDSNALPRSFISGVVDKVEFATTNGSTDYTTQASIAYPPPPNHSPMPSASATPYTPVPSTAEFQKVMFEAQQGVNGTGDNSSTQIKTPTFLFKCSGREEKTDGSTGDETLPNSGSRTVRFEVGTKVCYFLLASRISAFLLPAVVNQKQYKYYSKVPPQTATKLGKTRRKANIPFDASITVKSDAASHPAAAGVFSFGKVPLPASSIFSSQNKTGDALPLGAVASSPCFNLGPGSLKSKNQNGKRTTRRTMTKQTASVHVNRTINNEVPSSCPSVSLDAGIHSPPQLQSNFSSDTPSAYTPMSLCSPDSNSSSKQVEECIGKQPSLFNDTTKGAHFFTVGSSTSSSGLQSSRLKTRTGRRTPQVTFASSTKNPNKMNGKEISGNFPITCSPSVVSVDACESKACIAQEVGNTGQFARAVSLREEARVHYSTGMYKTSILIYTEAIVIITKTSQLNQSTVPIVGQTAMSSKERELLSLLYANRSAALLMVGAFEAACSDCENAMKCIDETKIIGECGVTLAAKLHCRMARSLLKLGKLNEALSKFDYAISFSESAIKQLDYEHVNVSDSLQLLNRAVADATIGKGDVRRCKEVFDALKLKVINLHSLEDALSICPGLISLHEAKINFLAAAKRWSDVALHCEKMACDAVRLDGVFTADLHRYNTLFGIEKATHLKSDFFLDKGMFQGKKLASKAVAEAVRFLPESTLPLYLRSLRLEERYTEAARACTSLEELSASSSLRLHLKQGVRPAYCWLAAERDRLRRTVATKDRGDACFKTGDYRIAAMNYTQCLTVDSEIGSQPIKETAGGRLHAVLFCNRAACYMALKKFRDASADCSSALEIQVSSQTEEIYGFDS